MSAYFGEKAQKAILFSERAHRGQTRKGSGAPYILHPLCVSLILARVGADDDLLCAAILHDTVEDCGVTLREINDLFGERVSDMVREVTEAPCSLWRERKKSTEHKVGNMSREALLLKSADMIHNLSDLLSDIEKRGEEAAFSVFNASREEKLFHLTRMLLRMEERWPENPLLGEMKNKLKRVV